MRLLIMSDLHVEHGPRWSLPDDLPAHDVVVLAGDIHAPPAAAVEWATAEFSTPVVYVPGNHEFYGDQIDRQLTEGRLRSVETNVHFLDKRSVVIAGVRFVGCILWTDYLLYGSPSESMAEAARFLNDHRLIVGFRPGDALHRHREDLAYLEEALAQPHDGPTVVVTHHAPHPGSVAPQFINDPLTPSFASDLTATIERYKPEIWIHGHMHNPSDYVVGSTRIVCNPKGYGPHAVGTLPENTTFEPIIVEV